MTTHDQIMQLLHGTGMTLSSLSNSQGTWHTVCWGQHVVLVDQRPGMKALRAETLDEILEILPKDRKLQPRQHTSPDPWSDRYSLIIRWVI